MSRIRRIAPGLGRGGLLGNTEGPESYLRELDTLPSQFCRATGGTETVISQGGKFYRVHTFTDTDPTSLLLNFDGSNGSTTFTDDSGWGHAVTANGNSAISTTESKFGGSSAAFDGTGDYLTLNGSSNFAFGTGDFTIEFWVYFNATGSTVILYDTRASGSTTSAPVIYKTTGDVLIFFVNGSAQITGTTAVTSGEWHHITVARASGTTKLFLNGSQEGSPYSDANSYIVNPDRPMIGAAGTTDPPSNLLNGYIDSLRITKGQALYTAAFTPPTTALTRVGSGSLTFTRGGAVEYLVVGGGGGGAGGASSSRGGGGGGAGGYRFGVNAVSAKTTGIYVGGGGEGAAASSASNQYSGSASEAFGISSAGGGRAGTKQSVSPFSDGGDGGSGGGASSVFSGTAGTGGSGNVPSVSPAQGYDGGDGPVQSGGGGGGGASAAGANGSAGGGAGGAGASNSISGSSVTYAAGGDGGASSGSANGADATANTGDGGDGGGGGSINTVGGGSGGSGIVIARYRITQAEYEAEAA